MLKALRLKVGLLSQVLIKRDDGPEKEAHNLVHLYYVVQCTHHSKERDASNPQNLQSLTNDSGVFSTFNELKQLLQDLIF